MYVSTAYSQTHDKILYERHYPSTFQFDEMENYNKIIDENVLNALSHKYVLLLIT